MKKYWVLFWSFRKIQLMRMFEYRADFFFWMFVSLMWTGFNYFYFGMLFSQGNGIAGWSYDQMLILLSFFTMIDALTWSVYYPNMREYTAQVFNGELSKYLVLPVIPEFLITTQHATNHNIPRFIVGISVLITTAMKLRLSPSIFDIILITITFIASFFFLYSWWFILATCSFWVDKLDNINEVMPQMRSLYQIPVSIFTGITGFVFTFVIPFGLITTLPSEILLGKANYQLITYMLVASTLSVLLAIAFFRVSVKKYTSVGG